MTRPGVRPALLVAGCLGLAGLSLLHSAAPHYDAWGWIVWGREIADPHRTLSTLGGPAWKPLPVLFTTLFAPLGGAAPAAWLVVSRAGGALAVALAFILARRLAGVAAGAIAAVLLALSQGWLLQLSWGSADPLVAAAVLAAVLWHLDGRDERALVAGLAAALLRPEAWPFLGLAALWCWRRRTAPRALIAAVAVAVPVLWFVPDWLSTGDPFTGSHLARGSAQAVHLHRLGNPLTGALGRIAAVLPAPAWGLAALGLVLAAWVRDRVVLALGAFALGWATVVVLMALDGYAGLGRFALAAVAVACVLAGLGAVRAVWLVPGTVRPVLAIGLLAIVTAPFFVRAAEHEVRGVRADAAGGSTLSALRAAIDCAGGPARVRRWGPVVTNGSLQTALAWQLGVPLRRVGAQPSGADYVVFRGPATPYSGTPPAWRSRGTRPELLVRLGAWRVLRVTRRNSRGRVQAQRPARRT